MKTCMKEMIEFQNLIENDTAHMVYFRPFLEPDNGSKNSILNWVLKLNLVQQNFLIQICQ